MAAKVRLGFVGLGWWSEFLAEASLSSGRIEIAGCCSRTTEKVSAFCSRYEATPSSTYEELLDRSDIDAVVLTTPNSLHASQALGAAQAGKHVFVEKPMAQTVRDCREMIIAAEKAGVILTVGQNSRRMARYRKAEELIRRGDVGDIVLAEANSSGEYGMKATPKMWRWYRSESPGGPLTSFTVHHADNFNYLIGPIRRVAAFVSKLSGPMEADDVVSATVEFDSGALGYLGGSFITPERNFLQVHGTEGVVLVDEEEGLTYFQKRGTKRLLPFALPDPSTQRIDSLREEMDEFAECIQSGRAPEVGGQEGMAAVAVIEAILQSAESGLPVDVPSLYRGSE